MKSTQTQRPVRMPEEGENDIEAEEERDRERQREVEEEWGVKGKDRYRH